ncbi:MAG: biliverdin-producing heme oxygenase [Planctomycetota bacterium]
MSETATTPTIMDRLKAETQDLHDAAETHAHQSAMVKGELPLESYIAHLAQHYLVHEALEAHLRGATEVHPAFTEVITAQQYQAPYAEEDLRHFGVDPTVLEPTPGTSALIAQIDAAAREHPIKLLGYHYVLEGSNNGNRFIAMKLKKVYELEDGKGLKYLDPYGTAQRANWAEFKRQMLRLSFTAEHQDLMVQAAREMFEGITQISTDLVAASAS